MKISPITLGLTLVSLTASAAPHAWDSDNDPHNLDKTYQMNLNALPANGSTDTTHRGWSGSYWPKTRGYIADRWQIPEQAFKFKEYKLPTAAQIQKMSKAELNLLSPAEKIDIARGRFNLPLVNELRKDNPKDDDWWRGLCNGWTQASLYIDEPRPILYTEPKSKIQIPLTTGDIKGMLAYYYANRDDNGALYVGATCQPKKVGFVNLGSNSGCADNDVNAGAFHVVIANELGIKHQGISMDRDATYQVWNQPFVKFNSTYTDVSGRPTGRYAKGTVKQVNVKTEMVYANELYQDAPEESDENDEHVYETVDTILGTQQQSFKTVTYEYVLDLDSRGTILGGDWKDDSPHPDLIWKQDFSMPAMGSDDKDRNDDWSVLADIITKATQYAK